SDLDVGAIKTGMLGNLEIVEAGVEGLSYFPGVPVVVAPMMVSHSGHPLLTDEAIDAIRTKLMPLAVLVTPNLLEAARLLDEPVARDDAKMAPHAQRLRAQGASAALVKGGHATGPLAIDILADAEGTMRLQGPRTQNLNNHAAGHHRDAAPPNPKYPWDGLHAVRSHRRRARQGRHASPGACQGQGLCHGSNSRGRRAQDRQG